MDSRDALIEELRATIAKQAAQIERLTRRVADLLARAVRRAMPHVVRRRQFHFVARQMGRQLFVARRMREDELAAQYQPSREPSLVSSM
jgi:hypothetical protein